MGSVFRTAFRILGLGERKGRWAMEQDFHGDFQVNVTWFFACFSGLVWFERSLHSAQVCGQTCPWPLKLMTSQRVERTRIRTGGYKRFRGVWIKNHYYSLRIFPQFWLAKSTRIIHHSQLLMTKFGRILCLTRKWRKKCSPLQVKVPLPRRPGDEVELFWLWKQKWRTLHSFQE